MVSFCARQCKLKTPDAVDMDGHGHFAETIKFNFVLPDQGYLRQRCLLQLCSLRWRKTRLQCGSLLLIVSSYTSVSTPCPYTCTLPSTHIEKMEGFTWRMATCSPSNGLVTSFTLSEWQTPLDQNVADKKSVLCCRNRKRINSKSTMTSKTRQIQAPLYNTSLTTRNYVPLPGLGDPYRI